MSLRTWGALIILLASACDESFENTPRVTPASESLWLLLGLQLNLDGLRPVLVEFRGKSFEPDRIDKLTDEVLATCEYLSRGNLSDYELRAARYRVDLIALKWGLIQADALASSGRIGGSTHAGALKGVGWIDRAFDNIHRDPLWPIKDPVEADRTALMAASHRDDLRRSIPASAVMRQGVHATALTTGAIGMAKLAGALGRVLGFVGEAGGPAYVTAGFAGGMGSVQVLAGERALALTTEEVLALAATGVLSSAALAVFMEASEIHHICTDKNSVSDRNGGPWTPRFEEIFRNAGMSMQDPANLVRITAHKGPHPLEYHDTVIRTIEGELVGLRAGTAEYREALKRALASLAKEIQTPGTRLNLLVTGAIRK